MGGGGGSSVGVGTGVEPLTGGTIMVVRDTVMEVVGGREDGREEGGEGRGMITVDGEGKTASRDEKIVVVGVRSTVLEDGTEMMGESDGGEDTDMVEGRSDGGGDTDIVEGGESTGEVGTDVGAVVSGTGDDTSSVLLVMTDSGGASVGGVDVGIGGATDGG